MTRPSETLQATIATIVGAIVTVLATFDLNVPAKAVGPIITLLGYVAAGVTWYVGARQRLGEMTSARDGTVR